MPVSSLPLFALYAVPVLLIWIVHAVRMRNLERSSVAVKTEEVECGLTEPPSLHPVIDQRYCIGCASCVAACPENNVLGLIDRKAELIAPTRCIGHGACQQACPMGAISLVFGTEERGVDIPHIKDNFETNISGVFIAGELGGMGLIRNAIEQGRQAIEAVKKSLSARPSAPLDVVIVGAGPAGFSASLAAMDAGLSFVTLEQETLGGTVAHYPRGKLVMTAPVDLPIYGKARFRETSKEQLLEFWRKVERKTGVRIHYSERVEAVRPEGGVFVVTTAHRDYRARAVLLAIGRRGTPRKLGVKGEDKSKVVYRLIDPEQYRGQRVLVVGGGDSALEAAIALAEIPETPVTLSYRSEVFSRARKKNRERLAAMEAEGRLTVIMKSQVVEIGDACVTLEKDGQETKLDNDAVIVCAGGVLPTAFLKSIGIEVETKYGTA